jgi:hypothetical protein
MKVLPSHIAENAATRAASTRSSGTGKASFKSELQTAEITLKKGEEAVAVEGHAYSEITKGARAGMFINTSGNVRHGQTFTVAHRDGKEYHIYGTGKDRLVVGFHMPSSDKTSTTTTPTDTPDKADKVHTPDVKLRKNETIEPVEGHSYAEITSGAREGMYINTSGNKRHGDAFVLVNKAGVEYHIYGTGADREVIAIKRADDKDDE